MAWFPELSAEDRSWVGSSSRPVSAGSSTGTATRATTPWAAPPWPPRSSGPHPGPSPGSSTSSRPWTWSGSRSRSSRTTSTRSGPRGRARGPRRRTAYAREVAFATAEVYARAAEVRGAWDARLEALVVDAVLRSEADEALLSRASALGWSARGDVAVVLGTVPHGARDRPLRGGTPPRPVRGHGRALRGAERLVVLLGGISDSRRAPRPSSSCSGTGPWWWVRWPRTSPAATSLPARPCRRTARRPAGRKRPGRCGAASCCRSAPWPAAAARRHPDRGDLPAAGGRQAR